jgi:hypothetical protein
MDARNVERLNLKKNYRKCRIHFTPPDRLRRAVLPTVGVWRQASGVEYLGLHFHVYIHTI